MAVFTGIWVPLITPFAQGEVDHAALRRLVARYRQAGVAGLVALGTTGEPSTLSEVEQDAVLATVLAAAEGLPVVAGLSGNDPAAMLPRLRQLGTLPLAGILVPAPYYVRPSQAGILQFFTTLADASPHPLVIYDIPYRTGVRLEIPTLLALAAHPNIKAVKDCAGSLDSTLALVRDGRLAVLAGDDLQMFNNWCLGGQGAIAATAHVRTEEFVAAWRAIQAGRLAEGRAAYLRLVPWIQAAFMEPNPAPVKYVLAREGLIQNALRPPMLPVSAESAARLDTLFAS
ncbi:4-hydroxy-tetrahydrodipicolinate synthase [Chitinimonas sp.]|uniref:4-hydroxy-tetrahydrodipicolinate synthase n=1 Tax=Chitinimonas sp. TaxID=1934313 RepID=UPI002F9497AC